MKHVLLAGPGTGKTTNIKDIIEKNGGGSGFLILSFTNATVDDLRGSLSSLGVTGKNCMTLHSCALRMNNDVRRHILLPLEKEKMEDYICDAMGISFGQLCDFLSCTTYDQMIDRFVDFARANPVILEEKLSMYHSVIIDEFQDFNEHEQKLLDLIMDNIETAYILGDDDQCIYDFKQASADKIIALHLDTVNNSTIPHKHICYRCPDKVIEHGTNLIKNNRNRVDKKWSNQSEEGKVKDGTIQHKQLLSGDDVAQFIADKILSLDDPEVLILAPVDFTAKPVADKLNEIGIEFENHFDEKLSEEIIKLSWEAKSLYGKFTYFNLVILGYFLMKNSRTGYYKLLKKHYEHGESYQELFNLLKSKLPSDMVDPPLDIGTFLKKPRYTPLFDLFPYSEGDSDEEKLENILRHSEPREEHNIKLMTIHKSKGLGADYVFIVGVNDGIIPNKKRGNISLEGQRRLFYVGITRAKKELYILSNVIFDGGDINRVDSSKFRFRGPTNRTGFTSPFVTELKL